jgi:hypothetical protein
MSVDPETGLPWTAEALEKAMGEAKAAVEAALAAAAALPGDQGAAVTAWTPEWEQALVEEAVAKAEAAAVKAAVEAWEAEKAMGGDVQAWEPVRQIVQAPDGRMWLMDAVAGKVERQILLDEIQGWADYQDLKPISVGGVLTWHPPVGYTGPKWEMHRKTWAQMAKLGRCTCEGTKPAEEHYAGCCLVTIAAGAHLMTPPS